MSDHYDRYNGMENLLGTNLAEVGTDLISRKQAIDALENDKAALSQIISGMSANDAQLDHYLAQRNQVVYDIDAIKQLQPIQPEIVRCEECLYRKICSWEKQGAKFCSFAEKREVTE